MKKLNELKKLCQLLQGNLLMSDLIDVSEIEDKYTSTGRHSGYKVNMYHYGLKEYKHLSAIDVYALNGKISNQKLKWKAKWGIETTKRENQSKEEQAKEKTLEAEKEIERVQNILKHTLNINDAIDWETIKFKDEFSLEQQPHQFIHFKKSNGYPETFDSLSLLPPPDTKEYFTNIGFFDKLFGHAKTKLENQCRDFDIAVKANEKENSKINEENGKRLLELKTKQSHWESEKEKFENRQTEHNEKVEELKSRYQEKKQEAVLEYCEMVLNNSEYIDSLAKEFELRFNPSNNMLLVDYRLPAPKDLPSINKVKYIKSRDEIEIKELSNTAKSKLYDSAIYQIVLRTLHELFEADTIDALKAINLNGFVTDTNPATGHKETTCIVSIQSSKTEFEAINLKGIVESESYKECFKALKGVGSSKLFAITAIKPLIEIDKSDKRFRDHYDVADSLNDEINLAAMDWQDFEHLIREIFAKEFTENGGEVKVTQASADGGVDAIAFDPDPIRGGKIVIQAKRYTNVVGVSAIRDLYGTVMSEGATKGIIVTTSDYGTDSYEFAKGKPLTLLNGSNLLYLLEKHGHKAKIDIKEAKKLLQN